MSSPSTAFEHANLGWGGAQTSVFMNSLNDAIAAGIIPDVAILPSGSPNAVSVTITAAQVTTARRRLAEMQATCRTNLIAPVLVSWAPTNTAVKSYGATASLRSAYAQDIEARAAKGQLVLAASSALSGATDGNSQVQMIVGLTSDNIHPNDAGNAVLSALLANELASLVA